MHAHHYHAATSGTNKLRTLVTHLHTGPVHAQESAPDVRLLRLPSARGSSMQLLQPRLLQLPVNTAAQLHPLSFGGLQQQQQPHDHYQQQHLRRQINSDQTCNDFGAATAVLPDAHEAFTAMPAGLAAGRRAAQLLQGLHGVAPPHGAGQQQNQNAYQPLHVADASVSGAELPAQTLPALQQIQPAVPLRVCSAVQQLMPGAGPDAGEAPLHALVQAADSAVQTEAPPCLQAGAAATVPLALQATGQARLHTTTAAAYRCRSPPKVSSPRRAAGGRGSPRRAAGGSSNNRRARLLQGLKARSWLRLQQQQNAGPLPAAEQGISSHSGHQCRQNPDVNHAADAAQRLLQQLHALLSTNPTAAAAAGAPAPTEAAVAAVAAAEKEEVTAPLNAMTASMLLGAGEGVLLVSPGNQQLLRLGRPGQTELGVSETTVTLLAADRHGGLDPELSACTSSSQGGKQQQQQSDLPPHSIVQEAAPPPVPLLQRRMLSQAPPTSMMPASSSEALGRLQAKQRQLQALVAGGEASPVAISALAREVAQLAEEIQKGATPASTQLPLTPPSELVATDVSSQLLAKQRQQPPDPEQVPNLLQEQQQKQKQPGQASRVHPEALVALAAAAGAGAAAAICASPTQGAHAAAQASANKVGTALDARQQSALELAQLILGAFASSGGAIAGDVAATPCVAATATTATTADDSNGSARVAAAAGMSAAPPHGHHRHYEPPLYHRFAEVLDLRGPDGTGLGQGCPTCDSGVHAAGFSSVGKAMGLGSPGAFLDTQQQQQCCQENTSVGSATNLGCCCATCPSHMASHALHDNPNPQHTMQHRAMPRMRVSSSRNGGGNLATGKTRRSAAQGTAHGLAVGADAQPAHDQLQVISTGASRSGGRRMTARTSRMSTVAAAEQGDTWATVQTKQLAELWAQWQQQQQQQDSNGSTLRQSLQPLPQGSVANTELQDSAQLRALADGCANLADTVARATAARTAARTAAAARSAHLRSELESLMGMLGEVDSLAATLQDDARGHSDELSACFAAL